MILQLENDNKARNEFHEDGEKCEKGMYIFFFKYLQQYYVFQLKYNIQKNIKNISIYNQ